MDCARAISPDSIQIHYRAAGESGMALLFVHGLGCDSEFWSGQMEHFRARYRCIAIDLAGHGESGDAREDWTIDAFAGDVVAVARDVGRPLILVGNSIGGPVCAEAALRLPGLVRGLIGVETFHWFGMNLSAESISPISRQYETDFAGAVEATVRGWFPDSSDPDLVERVLRRILGASPAMVLSALEHFLTWHLERGRQVLKSLDVPVCTINSGYLEPAVSLGLRRLGLEVSLIEQVGHFPMLERPAVFNDLLGREIERLLKLGN